MPPRKHQELMTAAVERDGAAHQSLVDGHADDARAAFAQAAELYRQSWEEAPASAYGRLVGMLKSAVLAGGGATEAAYAREALAEADPTSATAAYARAVAALTLDEDGEAELWASRMGAGGEAFARTAQAIAALAVHDGDEYASALSAIVRDFEQRSDHLTGVAIADTALMLAMLADRRGMAAAIESPVLPAF